MSSSQLLQPTTNVAKCVENSGELRPGAYGVGGRTFDEELSPSPVQSTDEQSVPEEPDDEDKANEADEIEKAEVQLAPSKDDDESNTRKYIIIGVVVLVLVAVAGIGLGVGLSSGGGSSNDPPTFAPTETPSCDLSSLLYEPCQNGVDLDGQSLLSQLSQNPICAGRPESYEQIVQRIQTEVDPNFSEQGGSCDPSNLAIWSMTDSVSQELLQTSLVDLYVWRTFYFATGLIDGFSDSWLSNESFCEWQGVTCGISMPGNNRSVVVLEKIQLFRVNLRGTLPSELGLATNLESLHFVDALSLVGNLPSELGTMSRLNYLNITSTSLTGTLPSELCSLPTLETLVLNGGFLSGTLPSELGNCEALAVFEGISNSFTGTIPSELWTLGNLVRVGLGSNPFNEFPFPTEIWELENLTTLALYSMSLNGTLPTEVGLLTNLEKFLVDLNRLSGTIPSQLGNLTNLERLFLGGNRLTGQMPTELGRLTNLQIFSFDGNDLSGAIPDEVCSLWDHDLEILGVRNGQSSCNGAFSGLTCPSQSCCPICFAASGQSRSV